MNEDEILNYLRRIDERLERLEQKSLKSSPLEQIPLPAEVSILTDSIDQVFDPSTDMGQENLAKFEQSKELMRMLSEKETLVAFTKLTKTLQQTAPLLENLGELENTLSILVDSIDEIMGKAMANGINIEELSENLKRTSTELLELMESGALAQLLESGILDKKSIEVVGALGQSLAVSQSHQKRATPWSIVTSIFNQDIQRSIGFALNLAVHFGRKLKQRGIK